MKPTDEYTLTQQFEQRKRDHIQLALKSENQAQQTNLERVQLVHNALPDINFDDIDIHNDSLTHQSIKPFLVSSMTAGHQQATAINTTLAKACAQKGWFMGVGSQRRQLTDAQATKEWHRIRAEVPKVKLFANLGIAQAITSSIEQIKIICESINAYGLFIHLNSLQECMQPEGTPQFKHSLQAIQKISEKLSIPVIIKETGCGFSASTLQQLNKTSIAAVDISGFGGTHWGRIEGQRTQQTQQQAAAEVFKNWGISTVDCMLNALNINPHYEIWGSGGVRTGLDSAKLFAMGAKRIGLAKPMLENALTGVDAVVNAMDQIEYELKIALFCTGHSTITSLQESQIWQLTT